MNGFDKLFKPKYEVDPNDVVFRNPNDYSYHERNWTSWTKYNPMWENNDNEELGNVFIILLIFIIIIIDILRFILLY